MKKICRRNARGTISFERLYDEFIDSRKMRNVRESTITSYNKNIKNFKNWLPESHFEDISKITKKTINEYVLFLQSSLKNQSTINSYLRAVKAVLYFAMEEEQDYLATFKFKLPKEDSQVGSVYSEIELEKLLKKPNFLKCTDNEYKMWVIVNYMVETGNRLSTVISLKTEHIDFGQNQIMLSHTKNREIMFIPISPMLKKILVKYMNDFGIFEQKYLFPNMFAKQYTPSGLAHEIAKYNKLRKVNKTTTHGFRRTFATYYIHQGGDPITLKRLLGHKSYKMTEKYVRVYDKKYLDNNEEFSILKKYNKQKEIVRINK
jgi:integrase/recombinase XerD